MSVNIAETANDLPCDDLAFECEELAKQADVICERGFAIADMPVSEEISQVAADLARVCRLIASTNRNMARMMNRG